MLLINVKMPTIVGILTSINMTNTTYDRLKSRYFFICWYFSFYEQMKYRITSLSRGATGPGGGTLIYSSFVGSGPESTIHPKKIQEF